MTTALVDEERTLWGPLSAPLVRSFHSRSPWGALQEALKLRIRRKGDRQRGRIKATLEYPLSDGFGDAIWSYIEW